MASRLLGSAGELEAPQINVALFLLFYRGKNDPVGENISSENEVFRVQLTKHLGMLREDIAAGRIEVIDTTG